MATAFFLCGDALLVFLQERNIFMGETAQNTHRRSSYVIAHALVSLPSFALSVTTFWAAGLDRGLLGFLFYFSMNSAAFWAGSSVVTFISGLCLKSFFIFK